MASRKTKRGLVDPPSAHGLGVSAHSASRSWGYSLRTLAAGVLVGVIGALLTLAGIALVERDRQPNFAPDVPPEIVDAARSASNPPDAGPEWRIAADVDSPFGRVIRLRPHLNSIEVRGADCLLQFPDFADKTAGQAKPGDTGHCVPPHLPSVKHERPPGSVGWREIAELLADTPDNTANLLHTALALRDGCTLNHATRADPVMYVSLPDKGSEEWTLRIEVSLHTPDQAIRQALEALPWRSRGEQPMDIAGDNRQPDLSSGPVDLLLILDPSDFSILEARDLRIYAADELVGKALVFDPSPVASSGRSDLRDGDPVDQYRIWMDAPRLDGSGYLRGLWIETANDRPPLARETSLVFAYPSYDPRFEEAMAYVHGDRALQRVADLGFTGLFSKRLRLRVHGTTADNSWYSRATREIVYGSGGVDDAEDADIILHEIGHAIHDALVPGFDGGDTYAISEGFSDFWAASLTGGPCIGDWDATSYSPPCLRRTDTDAVFPNSLNGRPHNDGLIWSAALWDIRGLLGAETAELLALASFLEQGTRTTFPEAAAGLLIAAERLGMHDSLHLVRTVLEDRGLLPRSISAEILPDDTYTIHLHGPGRILGGWARTLVISGDGRLFFPHEASGVFSLPFPQGPPCIAPLAWGDATPCDVPDATPGMAAGLLAEGGDAPIFTTLHVTGSVSSTLVELELEWMDPAGSKGRVDASWALDTGDFTWEYRHFRSAASGLYFGVSSGNISADLLMPVRLVDLPRSGLLDAHGFRSDLGDSQSPDWLPNLVGARFTLTHDGETSGIRLVTLASPLSQGRLTLAAHPNPFHDSVHVRLRLEKDHHAVVSVFDAQGRRVRSLLGETLREGAHTVEWDGRDDAGRSLPSAVYWIRAAAGGDQSTASVLILR